MSYVPKKLKSRLPGATPTAASVLPGSPGYPEASRFREWPSARIIAGRGWCHDSRLKLLGEYVM